MYSFFHFFFTRCLFVSTQIQKSVEALVQMGYNRQDIEESLSQVRYDDVFATYLLLGRKSTDVSQYSLSHSLFLVHDF